MNMNDNDKALLLNNGASTLSNIVLFDNEGNQEFLFNEDNYLVEWEYEDYRYVPENGFIGQFVERIFDGKLLDIPENISLDGKIIKPELGIQDNENSTANYYSLGSFMITQVGEKDTNGMYSFQSSDLTKKFNVLYEDFGKYPCLALELVNSTCEQVGVPYDSDGNCWCYAITVDGMPAGNYCFKIDDTYYKFTTSVDLQLKDSLMYIESTNKLIQKRVVFEDDEYKVVRTELAFTTGDSAVGDELLGSYIPYYAFTNNDFVIEDNQFDEDELCRDVIKAIAKLAYTWARVGEDDKLHLDFTPKTVQQVDTYDIIDVNKYYENITTGETVKPVNKVLIGMSQIDGENVYDSQNGDRIRLDKLNGETSQSGTPTPSAPVNVNTVTGRNVAKVSGKNLFDAELAKTKGTGGSNETLMSIQLKPNTQYTLSRFVNTTFAKDNGYYLYFVKNEDTSTRIFDLMYSSMSNPIESGNSTIITGNSGIIKLIGVYVTNARIQNYLDNINVQIEEGSTATNYVPYKKQEYEINLGKNLYNKNTMPLIHGLWYGNGAITSNNAGNVVIVPITGGKTYTISKKNSGGDYGLYTTTTATYPAAGVSVIDTWAGGDTTTKTLTTNINAKYLFIALLAKGSPSEEEQAGAIEELQVEEGPIATNYAPYFEPIELCKIGDYQDYITKNTGKNLININNFVMGGMDSGVPNPNMKYRINNAAYAIDVKPNTKYTISANLNDTVKGIRVGIHSCTGNGTFVSDSGWIGLALSPHTFTTASNIYKIKLIFSLSTTSTAVTTGGTENTTEFDTVNEWLRGVTLQLEEGPTATEYEPYGINEWYLYKEFGKVNLSSFTWTANDMSVQNYKRYTTTEIPNVSYVSNNTTLGIGIAEKYTMHIGSGLSNVTNAICIDVSMVQVTDKSTNNPSGIFYYKLKVPTVTKITNQDLINQLNTLNKNAITYDGDTYITVDTVNEKPSLNLTITDINQNSTTQTGKDISVVGHEYAESAIRIYDNPLTHNELLRKIALNGCERLFGITYTPLTINTIGHPWLYGDSYIKVINLSDQNLYTYAFDRKLTYKGYINSTISSTAENQVKQTYEYSKNMLYKITKTEIDVDKANNRITLLNKDVKDNYTKQSTFETTVDGITSRVETVEDKTADNGPIMSQISQVQQSVNAIQNLFQITGGTNLIKNSAFLLNDDVWEFTNVGSGTHYHTPLGQGYNGSVIGSVVSKSQVQLKNIKMSSKIDSENIQVSLLNTQHSFTYAYKMDANTTATIKLIDTTTNTAVYEETLTPTNTITKMQFPPKPAEGEEQQIFTPTAINYKLEVETQTTQDGSVYLYDMMFNSGDFKPWEPSSGEITSTILKLSMLGLQVISTGSNVATVMNASGFAVYPIDSSGNIGANPITSFNNVGLITGEAETTKVTIEKYVMDELQLDGKEHHVEYFKE